MRVGQATFEDKEIIDQWRAAHRAVLNTFQALLRTRARGHKIIVAQRHKRIATIFDKLRRFPQMNLARMDDIVGCRLIFQDLDELWDFRAKMHQARFNHRLKNDYEKYDYIVHPKETGYRGIHDVYEYHANSVMGAILRGLSIEIQYRTRIQHAWATAVEVIGHIADSQPKFQRGDERYHRAMALASEILARAHENKTACFPDKSNSDIVAEFLDINQSTSLLKLFKDLNSHSLHGSKFKNLILIIKPNSPIETRSFESAVAALKELFVLEKSMPGADLVLVRADSTGEVRDAFRNYFSDTTDFVRLIEDGCAKLSGLEITPQLS
ncbi:RelA/SpoT domain-containing protein [Asaia lannensis NBRC 102526]|nr:RelA/SpoT domain-containing protein [Asaia lannensis NBRC 102526]